jgi:hypothetical protein
MCNYCHQPILPDQPKLSTTSTDEIGRVYNYHDHCLELKRLTSGKDGKIQVL